MEPAGPTAGAGPGTPATPGPVLQFEVLGRPLPHGSKTALPIVQGGRVVGRRITESGDRRAKAAWRADVREAAARAMNGIPPHRGPVALSVRFYLARPAGHWGTGRNAGELKPSSPYHKLTAPDATKLVRGLEDALTGVCFADDAQVVDLHVSKRFCEHNESERSEVALLLL